MILSQDGSSITTWASEGKGRTGTSVETIEKTHLWYRASVAYLQRQGALGSGAAKATNLKIMFGIEDAKHRQLCIPEKRHMHSQERVILLQKKPNQTKKTYNKQQQTFSNTMRSFHTERALLKDEYGPSKPVRLSLTAVKWDVSKDHSKFVAGLFPWIHQMLIKTQEKKNLWVLTGAKIGIITHYFTAFSPEMGESELPKGRIKQHDKVRMLEAF